MATVRLVTPASSKTRSAAVFANQLQWLGYPASVFGCISATDFNDDLSKAAIQAVHELDQAFNADQNDVGVLVAAGTKAAGILQDTTDEYPIILALGGQRPKEKKNNLTGFVQNCVQIGKDHANKHKDRGHKVTLLWDHDADNPASQDVHKEVVNIIPKKDLTELTLSELSADKIADGFMIIPNAIYYENADLIGRIVDLSKAKEAYYPEIEYWRGHKNQPKIGKVHGHSVELTYRQAANWADNFLKERWALDHDFPDFTDAVIENYQWPSV